MNKIQKISRWLRIISPRRFGGRILRSASLNNSENPDWESLPKLLSIRSTANLLNVHPNTLRKWDQQGRLSAVRLGSRQDRRYERHRVQELWAVARQTPTDKLIARVISRQNAWYIFRRRWLRPLAVSTAAVAAIAVISQMNFVVASQPVPSSVTFTARDCSGWQKPQNAERINLTDQALPSEFTDKNSARYDVNNYRVSSRPGQEVATGNLDAAAGQFNCAGFTANDFPANGTITKATLVGSFVSQAVGNEPDGFILETSRDGKIWTVRGVISTRTEKTGRLTYDLGTGFNRDTLNNLRVRITPDVDIATPSTTARLDGFAIQADIVTPAPVDKKKDAEAKQNLNKLVAFSQATYASTETPIVTVPKRETKKLLWMTTKKVDWTLEKVTMVDSTKKTSTPKYATSEAVSGSNVSTSINFQTAGLHPGKYKVKVAMRNSDGGEATIEKEFLWGVVALNFDRPNPRPGDAVTVGMGVLDDAGITICDAEIEVKVTDPRGQTTTFSQKKKNLVTSGICVDKGVTNKPDYYFTYTPTINGAYHVVMVAKTSAGERRIEENLIVDESSNFDVQRSDYPTRIYPPEAYPVTIAITPSRDYSGIVTERVPADFAISAVSDQGTISPPAQPGDPQLIAWPTQWIANQTYYLRYTFDAPDISPALFLAGPLKIEANALSGADWQESRPWQIASDEAGAALAARAYTMGFELNSTTAGMEYTTNINTPTIVDKDDDSTKVRSGHYAMRANPTTSTQGIAYTFAATDDTNDWWARAYIYIASAPTAQTEVLVFRTSSDTDEASIRLNTDRTLELWDEYGSTSPGTPEQVGSDSATAVPLNTWTRVELAYSAGNVLTVARLDGVEFAADRGGRSFVNGARDVAFGVVTTNASADIYFDDLAINTGYYPNDNMENWPGEGSIVYIRPNGNGSNTAWNGDYTGVDEVTPDDATSYVNCTANSQVETYNLQDSSDVGIGAGDLIKLTAVNVRYGGGADANNRNVITRLYVSGFDNSTGTRNIASTSWVTNHNTTTVTKTPFSTSYDLPASTNYGKWTATDLDSAYIYLTASDCSPQQNVTAIWMAVEYQPAGGGRLFSSGFELQDTTAGMEWTTKDGSPTISTTTYRGGAAALRVSSLSSGTRQALNNGFYMYRYGSFYIRTYLYITAGPSAENRIIDLRNYDNSVSNAYITMDADRKLKLYDENGAIGSLSSALTTSAWYRIELHFDNSASPSDHTVEAKINGTVFATGTGTDSEVDVYQFGLGGNLNSEAQTTGEWFFDDVAVNQNYGTSQNGYPGPGKITHLRPNAAGNTDTWTKNPADCNGSSNYWECIDDVTPNDTTDYLSDQYGMTGGADSFAVNVTDTTTAGIASTDPITLVQVGIRAASSTTSAQQIFVQLRDGSGISATYVDSFRIATAATSWYSNTPSIPQPYPITAYTRPQKTSVWTAATLDSVQIGAGYLNNSNYQYISAEWLLVEYNPPEILVSGTVYSNNANETTAFDCSGTNLTLHVSTNGGTNADGLCTASNGTFLIAATAPATDNPVVLYVDSGETEKATTATLAADTTSAITLNLIQDRLLLSQESATAMTNAKLLTGDTTGNAGIRYEVGSGTLTVEGGMELHVLTGKAFAPGGAVITTATGTTAGAAGDLHIPATATLNMAANALSVGGDFTNAGTLTLSSGHTTTMTATGTGFTLTSGGQSLKGLTFNGSGGGWTNSGSLTVSESWTGTAGGFTQANSTTVTVNGTAFSLASGFTWTKAASGNNLILENAGLTFTDSNASKQNLGVVQIGASPGVVTLASDMSADTVTIPASDTLNTKGYEVTTTGAFACNSTCTLNLSDSGGSNEGDGTILDVGGDFTMSATGTLTPYTNSTLKMGGSSKTLTLNGKAIYNFEETGGSVTMSGATTVNNNVTITSGTLTAPSAANLNIGGSFTNAGTFTDISAGVFFTATTTGKTITAGSSLFGLLTFNGSGGEWTLKDNMTIGSITMTAGTLKSDNVTIKVNGDINGTNGIINMSSGTVVQYVYADWGDSHLGTTSGSTNWTFNNLTIADPIDDMPGESVTNSGGSGTITVNGTLFIGPIDDAANVSSLTNSGNRIFTVHDFETVAGSGYTASASAAFNVTGDWTNAGTFTHSDGTVMFTAADAGHTIAPGSSSFYNLTFDGSGGGWTMSDTTTVSNNLTITNGSLTAPASLSVGGNFTNAGTFVEGTGTVTLNGITSITLNSGCSDTTSCTTKNFYNLIINKTDAHDADDNVTLTTNGINVANTLTITDGELVQGALNVQVEGGTAVSIASAGKWSNVLTGDIKIGGTFANAGTLLLDNQGNSSGCLTGDTDDISWTSTTTDVRAISGAGTFTLYDVTVDYLNATVAITVNGGTDGGHNTGSWTFTGCGISVSGTVYQSSSETTVFDCDAVNLALRVSVNGAAATSGTCSAVGGTFTVSGVTAPSGADIPVAIYTDNTANPSQKATTVTLSSGTGSITGLTLIIDRVVLTHQGATVMNNTYLDTANNNGDTGIRYAVASSNLTVNDGMELHVLSGKSFTPGGTVTTSVSSDGTDSVMDGDLHIAGTMTMSTNALSVGGDLTNAGTLTVTGSQVTTMTATGTGFTLTSGGATMRDLIFNGASGGWTNSGALAATNMTLTDGAVTIDANTTVATALSVASGKTLTINSSKTVTLSAASGTSLTLDGTIAGAGTLIYQNATAFPTGGVITSLLRMDATDRNQAMDARTYGGQVEIYSNSSTAARTVTLSSGSPYTFSGNLHINANGTKDVTLDASANNPAVNITGDLKTVGTGYGTDIIASGGGTWTVSGSVDLTNGLYVPAIARLSPAWDRTALLEKSYDRECTITNTYSCQGASSNPLDVGARSDSGWAQCLGFGGDYFEYFRRSGMRFDLSSIPSDATITEAQLASYVTAVTADGVIIGRAQEDNPPVTEGACTNATLFDDLSPASTYEAIIGSDGYKESKLRIPGVVDIQSRITGSDLLTLTLTGDEVHGTGFDQLASSEDANNPPFLRVGYAASGTTPTLVMNGTGSLIGSDNAFYNLTLSGVVTMVEDPGFFVYHTLDLTGGTLSTSGSPQIVMSGATTTVIGGGQTVKKFTMAAGNTTTLTASNLNISGTLAFGSTGVLTIDADRTLTMSPGSTLALTAGTINGTGTLVYNTSTAFPTVGTLSSAVRFDSANVTTVPARTYGGPVTFYSGSGGVGRTITLGAGTFIFSSDVILSSPNGGALEVLLNTNDPTSTVTGDVIIGTNTVLSANSANAFNIKGDYTNNGTFIHNSGTVTVAGTSPQTFSGTLSGTGGKFNALTITNASGTVAFASALETAGTFTAATADTALQFAAGQTNTLLAINLSGTSGHLVSVRSSTPGTATIFNVGASSRTVSYVSVKDNNACGSTDGGIDAYDGTNVDEGNTPCWLINTLTVALSATTLNLGTLTANNISYQGVTSTITTNAKNGYISLVKYAGAMSNGTDTLADAGGTITAGTSGFGAATSKPSQTIAESTADPVCAVDQKFSAGPYAASSLSTNFQQFADKSTAAVADATTLCLLATTSAVQPPGAYQSTITIITTAKY